MIRTIFAVAAAAALTACTMTLPVRGQVQSTGETFEGSATGHMDGGGELTVTSAKTTCRGMFVYVNGREGSGTFTCDDGRSGPFSFVSTGARGTGYGSLGADHMTFSFGR